jgi:hypothetical protein
VRSQTLWLRVGRLYVPITARTPDGQPVEVGPVAVLRPDPAALGPLLAERLGASTPTATASPAAPAVPAAAGLPSWERFLVGAVGARLEEAADGWLIAVQRGDTPLASYTLARDATPDVLAEAALQALSAAVVAPTSRPSATGIAPAVAGDEPAPAPGQPGGTPAMLASASFAAVALAALALAVFSSIADRQPFGDPVNLAVFGTALLLLAVFLLIWEIVLRLVARAEE